MAKNNGKFTLFFMLFILALTLCLVIGMDKCEFATKKVAFDSNCKVADYDIDNKSDNNFLSMSKTSTKDVASGKKIELLCLMYHNVVGNTQKQGNYEVKQSVLEEDFKELKKLGYKCVDRKSLFDIVNKKQTGKYVMITFDDGFYGVYKYVPSLLEKYDMKCLVSVVGEFMDRQDKLTYRTRCSYMNTNEVRELAKNKRVEIAHHSYNLHHIQDGRRGVKIKKDETNDKYTQVFKEDTQKLTSKLNGLGVKVKTYCYPYGEFCRESERVLKGLNYQMTMTCVEKVNYLENKNSLFLLGRINRSANYQNITNLINKACNKK